MNEQTKTLIFTGAALAVLMLALGTRPHGAADSNQVAYQDILNEADPLAAKRLQIVKFIEETASIVPFEVAEIGGVWSIPSHQGYPADAEQQMAEAATSVMNLAVLAVVPGTDASTHASFFVMDPDIEKLTVGATGVGLRVTMQDGRDNKLADLIIGREVQNQPGQRYVREPGRDPVYIVQLDPSKLSTRFQDWIEDDLLAINTFDIKQVLVKDYSFEIVVTADGIQPTWDRRAEMTLSYDGGAAEWSIDLLKVFDPAAGEPGTGGEFVEVTPGEDEEVNNRALNDLKKALGDLKIIDVERKPAGLSQNLRAEKEFVQHNEAQQSLISRGFVLVGGTTDSEFEMLSSEGEVVCTMNDGVEYVLRFGQIALGSDPAESAADINRYIFVMARFNDSVIEKPQLAEPPDVPDEEAATDTTAEDAAEATAEDGPNEKDAAAAESEAVEQENLRRQDDYHEKVQKAKQRVLELNDRFADWYYVISDAEYKKIHLSRADVLNKKAAATVEGGVLEQLENLENALRNIP